MTDNPLIQAALSAGTHEAAMDDFGNVYLRRVQPASPDLRAALEDRIALAFAGGRPEDIDVKDEWWTTPRDLAQTAMSALDALGEEPR